MQQLNSYQVRADSRTATEGGKQHVSAATLLSHSSNSNMQMAAAIVVAAAAMAEAYALRQHKKQSVQGHCMAE